MGIALGRLRGQTPGSVCGSRWQDSWPEVEMEGEMGLKGWARALPGLLSSMTAHGPCPVGNQEPLRAVISGFKILLCLFCENGLE